MKGFDKRYQCMFLHILQENSHGHLILLGIQEALSKFGLKNHFQVERLAKIATMVSSDA